MLGMNVEMTYEVPEILVVMRGGGGGGEGGVNPSKRY